MVGPSSKKRTLRFPPMNPNLGSSIGLSRACLGLVCLAVSATVSAQVHFYGTGQLPGGGNYSQMRDAIRTPNGILAVGTATVFPNYYVDTSVMWTPDLGMVPLANDFPPSAPAAHVLARVISADGKVFGGSTNDNAPTPMGIAKISPALWTNTGGTVTLLGSLGLPPSNCGVNCLSADGSVAYGFILSRSVQLAFRYTAAGGTMSIGFLNPSDDGNSPTAHCGSSDGTVVVGNSSNSNGTTLLQAYRYTFTGSGPTGGYMTALPALPGGTWTNAVAMTPDATMTFGNCDSPDYPNGQLVCWHEGGPTEALGSPDPTFGIVQWGDVTADGSVVAIVLADATDQWCYIRNPSGWFKLQDILSDAGVDMTGWNLDLMGGISKDGTLVFGAGEHNGNTEGFVAEFPAGILRAYGDTTPPVLTLPGNIIAEATGPNGAIVNFSATATDAIDGPVGVVYSQNPVTIFPVGVTVVTVSATDAAGNKASGMFTVTVQDSTPPTFLALSASPSTIWPPNNKMVAVKLTANVVDTVSAATAHIIAVSCNEPASGDWQITGALTLSLRATRLGSGNGRIYTITVQATDAAGNSTTRTVTVSVPHDQGHG